MPLSLSIPPKNIRKPKVFWCLHRVSKETSGMKWVNSHRTLLSLTTRKNFGFVIIRNALSVLQRCKCVSYQCEIWIFFNRWFLGKRTCKFTYLLQSFLAKARSTAEYWKALNERYNLDKISALEAASGGVLQKKVFLKISQISLGNTCVEVSF